MLGAGICVVLLGLIAESDVRGRLEQQRAVSVQDLRVASATIERLVQAEQQRLNATLLGVRTELRAKDLWAPRPNAGAAPDGGARPDPQTIDARRLESVLRRALEANEDIAALEIVVAGHAGLDLFRVERAEDGIAQRRPPDGEREGLAKALWYSEDVVRAVDSAGRRVETGEVFLAEPEGIPDAIARPMTRASIGLHEPGELVQGALLAEIDRTRIADDLAGLLPPAVTPILLTTDGQPLVIDVGEGGGSQSSRASSLAARLFEQDAWDDPFEADGRLVLGRAVAAPAGREGEALLLALVESANAPTAGVVWLSSPWPFVLALVAVLAIAVGCAAAARRRIGLAGPGDPAATRASSARTPSIEIAYEATVTRDWLADVRACLERDAATRGLALELRCARNVRTGFETDPGWLGGLIVAMGREALDATARDSVTVEVSDSGAGLRFDVEAGGARLEPIAGMQGVARALGARFQAVEDHHLSLLVVDR